MDRATWLREVRRETKEEYTRLAPLYGEKYGLYISATHQQFVGAFLDLFPPGSLILDAACGSGLTAEGALVEVDRFAAFAAGMFAVEFV